MFPTLLTIASESEILFHISCILLEKAAILFLLEVPNFSFPVLSQFVFSLAILFLSSCLELFSSFYASVCILISNINGFIHIIFKVHEHIHNSYFEVLILRFSYTTFLCEYCRLWVLSWMSWIAYCVYHVKKKILSLMLWIVLVMVFITSKLSILGN